MAKLAASISARTTEPSSGSATSTVPVRMKNVPRAPPSPVLQTLAGCALFGYRRFPLRVVGIIGAYTLALTLLISPAGALTPAALTARPDRRART